MKKTLKYTYIFFLYAFAIIGLVLVGGFFAIRFHLTDTKGMIDKNNIDFAKNASANDIDILTINNGNINQGILSAQDLSQQIESLSKIKEIRTRNFCKIDAIGRYAPINARKIIEAYGNTVSDGLITKMIFAVELRLRERGEAGEMDNCNGSANRLKVDENAIAEKYKNAEGNNVFPWMNDEEWQTIREAIIKDKNDIDKAAQIANIPARLIVSNAIVEQVRLFHSQRELFKKVFQPLKILGNANKISLGIMGVKEETAIQVENNLKDPNSSYYLGKELESALDFSSGDQAGERFVRLTDEKNHYYSYLYGGLYLKEMMQQWSKAGYEIKYRPEIIGTLFNVGFPQCKPNADPNVGGSEISVGDAKYSFGSLVYEFYYSGELAEEFPFVVK